MRQPPCVVIDTNIWISYFFWKAPTILNAVRKIERDFEIITSKQALDELNEILRREKFDGLQGMSSRLEFFANVKRQSRLVSATAKVTDCPDPTDNKFLELAQSGNAAFIVTGDRDLLALDPWEGARIVTPADFLKLTAAAD